MANMVPANIAELTALVIKYEERLWEAKRIEDKYRFLKGVLECAIWNNGNPHFKSWEMPNGTKVTFIEPTEDTYEIEKKLDEEAFKALFPEAYEAYLSCFVAEEKLKKGRKGYVRITVPKHERTD